MAEPAKALMEARKRDLEKIVPYLETLLGGPEQVKKFEQFVHLAIIRNRTILECTELSFLLSLIYCAQKGLQPGVDDGCWLIPFKVKGVLTCTPVPAYKGIMKVAEETGSLTDIQAYPVYRQDDFEEEMGTHPAIHHKRPKLGTDRGELIGAYVVFTKPDGTKRWHLMDRPEIEKIRNSGAAWRNRPGEGPWGDWEEAMFLKTVIKQGLKQIPIKERLRDLLYDDNRLEGGATVGALIAETGMEPPPGIEWEEAPAPPPGPTEEAKKFDLLVDKALKGIDDALYQEKINRMDRFLAATAENQKKRKVSVEDLKTRAIENWKPFWTAFEAWEGATFKPAPPDMTQKAPTETPPETPQAASEPPQEESGPAVEPKVLFFSEFATVAWNAILQSGIPIADLEDLGVKPGLEGPASITPENIDAVNERVANYKPKRRGKNA